MPHANKTTQKYISKRQTAGRYGKNDRTITRWVGDPKLDFPQPVMINRRWFFEEAKLDEFDRRLALARLRDLARRHHADDKVKSAQCDLAGGGHGNDKINEMQSAGGEA